MLARLRVFVLSFALPAAAGAQGQAFEYAPGTAQFRITQKGKLSQEMMGAKQDGESSTTQVFTLTLARPARDTVAATYVVDTVTASTTMGGAVPGMERFAGIKVDVKLSPTGQTVYSTTGPTEEEVPNSGPVVTGLSGFLPKMRPTISRGMSWADTTTGKISQFGIEIDRRVISRNHVVKDTTVGGTRAWLVQRNDSATVSGGGTGPSGPMTMEGTSNARTTYVVTPKGAILGADATEDVQMRLVLSSNGMEIKITTTNETKIAKVK